MLLPGRIGLAVHNKHQILAVNATICARLGYKPGQLMSCSPNQILHHDYHQNVGRALAAENHHRAVPAVLVCHDGGLVRVRLRSEPAPYRGRPARVVHVYWDD